ncbi:MAG TPA: fluoride efflux transporter CrcB [Bryobacteraceae bacterium]|nr:fluoride efflux transporter CrcB [Bryobacteraceae bacterium]
MLNNILVVMLGGGIGSALRFVAGTYVTRLYGGVFPMGTFLINVTGSFLIGVLMTLFISRSDMNPVWRLFFVTGVLGGYTTFSSFEWESFAAVKGGVPLVAVLNVTLSVALGFLGVWLGSLLAGKTRWN